MLFVDSVCGTPNPVWGRGAEWNKLPLSFNGAHEEENCISYAEKLLGNKSNLF